MKARIMQAWIAAGLALGMITAAGAPAMAQSASKRKARQNDKNLMRNLGVGLGAAAVHQGVTGKTTNALVLGAGAALAGKKYEDARKAQRKENTVWYKNRYNKNGKKIGYYKYQGNKRLGYYPT